MKRSRVLNLMKVLVMFGTLFAGILPAFADPAFFASDFRPKKVKVLPRTVFAPMGFDNDDEAQIVIVSYLPTSCDKILPFDSEQDKTIDTENKTITLRHYNSHRESSWCAFTETRQPLEINLGQIAVAGKYAVFFEDNAGNPVKLGELHISESTSPVDPKTGAKVPSDDSIYAAVDKSMTRIEKTSDGRFELVLIGERANSCLDFHEVKTIYRAPTKAVRVGEAPRNAVIEVLPIMEKKDVDAGGEPIVCAASSSRFERRIALEPRKAGLTLVHIRSMHREAVNIVYEF